MIKQDIVRGVPLNHPGCEALANAGIRSLGIDDRMRGSQWGEGLSSTHLAFILMKGSVHLQHGKPFAQAGEILLVPSHTPKDFASPQHKTRALYIHFLRNNRWGIAPEAVSVLSRVDTQRLELIVEALLTETYDDSAEGINLTRRWLKVLLPYLDRIFSHQNNPGMSELRAKLDAIWDAVKTNLAENWSVARLADLAHMSEGHFHRRVVALYQRRPIQIVRRLRLERAADLLRTTNATIDAIATTVGYGTGFALSNAMQQEMGKRPSEFRIVG